MTYLHTLVKCKFYIISKQINITIFETNLQFIKYLYKVNYSLMSKKFIIAIFIKKNTKRTSSLMKL